jgi:hypothetical protein
MLVRAMVQSLLRPPNCLSLTILTPPSRSRSRRTKRRRSLPGAAEEDLSNTKMTINLLATFDIAKTFAGMKDLALVIYHAAAVHMVDYICLPLAFSS